ncbi:MAG TPA: glycosyltransferase family 4 protein [Anaerolineaceae bacterium]
MNLLYTITAYPPSTGGGQLHTHQLARQLASRHTVQVATLWDSHRTDWLIGTTLRAHAPGKAYVIDGVPVQRVGFNAWEKACMAPFTAVYYPLMDVCLPVLARIAERRLTDLAKESDLIHNVRIGREAWSFASLRAARRRGIPFVFSPLHHPRWQGWLYRHYLWLYRQADAVIALTGAEKRILAQMGVREERIHVTGIGPILAETSRPAAFRAQYGLGEDPLVLFLGKKFEYKGVGALLQAAELVWRDAPETHFVFMGPRTDYSRRLFGLGSDRRVLEIDEVDLQTKTDALAACTLLCLPSTQESFGGVYTEAWSFGKPVIGCDIPAVAEVIREGENGFLVHQEPGEIAARVLDLLRNPALAQQMGAAGERQVQERYTWARLAGLMEEIYASLV